MRCLDIACNEGFFSFELAKRGAREVVGFDARASVIEKAEYVRSRVKCPNASFCVYDIEQLSPEWKGGFDVVLCLGIIYHLENPIGCLRRVRSVTQKVCVIDSTASRARSRLRTDGRPSSRVAPGR